MVHQTIKRNLLIGFAVFAFGISKIVGQPNNLTNSLSQAERYFHENPLRAIDFANKAKDLAKNQADSLSLTQAYCILSQINIELANFDLATQYLDSAKQLLNTNYPHPITFHIAKTEVDFIVATKSNEQAIEKVNQWLNATSTNSEIEKHIKLLLLRAELYRQDKNNDLALSTINSALDIAQEHQKNKLIALCHSALASIQLQRGEYTAAINEYTQSQNIYKTLNDTSNLLKSQRNISIAYRNRGYYDTSLNILKQSLHIALQSNNPDEISYIYNLIGSVYARMGKPSMAIENYNQSLMLRKENLLLASYASTLENISRIQRDLGQYDEALNNINLTLDIRQKLNDPQPLASAYNEMGSLLAQQGDMANALTNYLKALKIRQEHNLHPDVSRSLINIGVTYRQLKSHKNALKYFTNALDLISDIADPIGKSWVYIHLGNTHRDLNNINEAITYYTKALSIRKKTGNNKLIAQATRSLAVAYGEANQFAKAQELFAQAIEAAKEQNDDKTLADIYNEMGNLALQENKLTEALSQFQQAAQLYSKLFDLDRKGLCIRKIGEIHTKLGNSIQAMENLKLALDIANKTKNAKLKELSLLALYNYHNKQNQYKNALDFYTKHISIRDSLNAIASQEAIWQASLDLELNKKVEEIKAIEGEVETLRAEAKLKTIELEQQRMFRNFLIIISTFVFIIAIGSVYGYVVIRKKNDKLNTANENLAHSEKELQKTVHTKDKLFSIIAHDLRSPFTALVGLTKVLSAEAGNMNSQEIGEYGTLIHESSSKLLSLIENLLYWSRSQTGKLKLTPKEINLQYLVNDVLNVQQLQAKAKSIVIENKVPEEIRVMADYETISTVIRNLISNAIKFTNTNGKIIAQAYENDGWVDIKIADNGVGINPENLDKLFKLEQSFSTKGTSQEAGTGLGLVVCKEFVEQNNGTIYVDSKEGEGTTFTIRLPKA